MKKFLFSAFVLALACVCLLTSCNKKKNTDEEKDSQDKGGLVYEEIVVPNIPYEYGTSTYDMEAWIYSYTGNEKDVVIPSEVMDPNSGEMCPVVEIAENAFFSNDDIESVVVPEGVKKIAMGAFQSCTNLKKVVLPSTLEEIGDRAFVGSDAITEMTIPASVKKIGMMAFSALNYAMPWYENLEGNPVIVGDGILLSYEGSGSVSFGPEVKHVAYYAFANTDVTEVTFSEALESIDKTAFTGTKAKVLLNANCPAIDTVSGITYEVYGEQESVEAGE